MSLGIVCGNAMLATLDSANFFASSNKDKLGVLESIDITNSFRHYKSGFDHCAMPESGLWNGVSQLCGRDCPDCIIVPN